MSPTSRLRKKARPAASVSASVVIPAYNEGARLPGFLAVLGAGLRALSTPIELIVVDDGSRAADLAEHRAATEALQGALQSSEHRVRLLAAGENRGKAGAIRLGWEASSPEAAWLGFLDADGAVPAAEFLRLLRKLEGADFDALAGSRVKMAGREIERSPFRHVQGRVFATLVEVALELGLYDPQCGLKLFRAALLRPELEALRESTWLLDVEVLARLKRRGARLREEPIDWADAGHSKVSFGIDPIKMAIGLFGLRRRLDREAAR